MAVVRSSDSMYCLVPRKKLIIHVDFSLARWKGMFQHHGFCTTVGIAARPVASECRRALEPAALPHRLSLKICRWCSGPTTKSWCSCSPSLALCVGLGDGIGELGRPACHPSKSWSCQLLALPVEGCTLRPTRLHYVHFHPAHRPTQVDWLSRLRRASSRKKSWHELRGVSVPTNNKQLLLAHL